MRFLLTRRWLQYIALAVVAAIACGLLANWQNSRRESRDAEIERIEANYSAAPVPVDEVADAPDAEFGEDEEWTRVTARGSYRAEDTLVARNRPKDGSAGYWVLVPFVTNDGATLLMARGWLGGSGADATTAQLPDPPAGEVTVTAWLRPAQTGDPGENTASNADAVASVSAIDPGLVLGETAYQNMYGYLDAEDPAPAEAVDPLPEPDTDPGSHLSYTMQWITFGIMILAGVVYAAKRERDALRSGRRRVPSEEPAEYVVVDKAALMAGARVRTAGGAENRGPRYERRPDQRRIVNRHRARTEADEDAALEEQLR